MKRSKFTLMLIVIALCCFAFAGTALAGTTASMVVKADGMTYAYTGCENSYTFELTDIVGLDAGCLEEKGGTIYISFKHADGSWPSQGFDIWEGVSLPVKIYVENNGVGQWIFTQPTIWTDRANYAELKIEPMSLEGKITKIFIGDDQQDLWVTNSCCARSYCIEVAMNTNCGDFSVIKNFAIKSSPFGITADVSASRQMNLPCTEAISVVGKVYDCGNNFVPNWPLHVAVIDTKTDEVVATAQGQSDGIGMYDIDFLAPNIGPGDYRVEVTAEGACADPVGTSYFHVDYNVATHIEIVVTDADGVDGQLRFNKCNKVCIRLLDDCGFPAVFKEDPKVYLTATTPGNPPIVAGHFYNDCPPLDARDGNQVNYVRFEEGQTEQCLFLVPLITGDITLTAAGTAGGNPLLETLVVTSHAPDSVDMEVTPLVTDENGNPKAGWPLAVAVRLNLTSSEIYNVYFTANGEPIDFDTKLVAAYDYQDASNNASYKYCTKKIYYYLYPDKDVRGDLNIQVTVEGVGATSQLVGSFVSPVELERTLKTDAWQTFSTPKLLAAPGEETPEYGTFEDLLAPVLDELRDVPSDEIFVLGYRNGCWYLPDTNDIVDPLSGYFVRTPQREEAGRDPYVIQYVFARATDPSMSMPYWLDLDEVIEPPTVDVAVQAELLEDVHLAPESWNSIGVGVDPKLEDSLTRQSDTAAHAYGSLLKGEASYLLWNPGTKLANVNTDFVTNALGGSAFPNNTYDAFTPMYNGDVYWMYGSCWDQDFSTNIGLDIIEWVGCDYSTDFPNQGF